MLARILHAIHTITKMTHNTTGESVVGISEDMVPKKSNDVVPNIYR
jgi:hypothetical protein